MQYVCKMQIKDMKHQRTSTFLCRTTTTRYTLIFVNNLMRLQFKEVKIIFTKCNWSIVQRFGAATNCQAPNRYRMHNHGVHQ